LTVAPFRGIFRGVFLPRRVSWKRSTSRLVMSLSILFPSDVRYQKVTRRRRLSKDHATIRFIFQPFLRFQMKGKTHRKRQTKRTCRVTSCCAPEFFRHVTPTGFRVTFTQQTLDMHSRQIASQANHYKYSGSMFAAYGASSVHAQHAEACTANMFRRYLRERE
jgi:hypothetical protein